MSWIRGAALAAALALSAVCAAQDEAPLRFDGHKLVEVELATPADLDRMLEISSDHWTCGVGLGRVPFRVPPEKMDELAASGLKFHVLLDNVQPLLDREQAQLAARGGGWFESFHTRDEINAYIDTLVALRPDLVTKINLGNSLQGRAIYAMRITGTNGTAGKPAVLFSGCQHAREWIATMVPMYIADQLARNYEDDAEIHRLLDGVVFYIIPLVNPDGYVYTWTTNRMWRKNRRGGYGVDLNRNWGVGWGLASGSSGSTGSETYRGTAPFSEPETQVVRNFVQARPEIQAHIDFHSYGQLVLSPWGYELGAPDEPDASTFRELNRLIATSILNTHGRYYDRGPAGSTLYLAAGTFPDWTYGDRGAFGWTIELRPTASPGFVLDAVDIIPTGEESFAAASRLAAWVGRLLAIEFPAGAPQTVEPQTPAPLTIRVGPRAASLAAGTARLYVRTLNEESFAEISLAPAGGDLFTAELPPAACGETLEYYVAAQTTDGRTETNPPGAPSELLLATAWPLLVEDRLSVESGWQVGAPDDTADQGVWGRGNPSGAGYRGLATNPEDDHSVDGLACYYTDGRDGQFPTGTTVRNGKTTLLTPVYDLSAAADPYISYWRWYVNNAAGFPNEDMLVVEISSDGGQTWTNVETVGPAGVTAGWQPHSFRVAALTPVTDQVRLRFVASDYGGVSQVEAGVDDLRIEDRGCGAAACPGDLTGDGVIELTDLSVLLAHFGQPAAATEGDLSGDGVVDLTDLSLLLSLFGESCGA